MSNNGNDQQKRMAAAQSEAANARTPEAKSRADAKLVRIICETPKGGR